MKCRLGWEGTASELITESRLANTQTAGLSRKPDEYFWVFLEASMPLDAEGLDPWNHIFRARRRVRLNNGGGGIFFKHEAHAAGAMRSSENALLAHSKPPNSCT